MSQNPSWNNESNLVIILLNIFLPLQFEVPAALLWPYKMYLLEDFWQNCHSWTLFLQLGSDFYNKELLFTQVFHTHLSLSTFAPLCACPWDCSMAAGAAPGTQDPAGLLAPLHTQPDHSSFLQFSVCLSWFLATTHPLDNAIRFSLFIRPSARVILGLGYVRTYV